MPNPFIRTGTPNQSTQPPERPKPIEPIPEHYHGSNHPYRGTEDHGVPDTVHPDEMDGYEGTVDAFFELEPAPPEVVPVRIVEQNNARDYRQFHSLQFPVPNTNVVQIASRDLNRASIKIKEIAGNVIWISGDSNMAAGTGYPVSNSELSLTTHGPLYAISGPVASTAYVGIETGGKI